MDALDSAEDVWLAGGVYTGFLSAGGTVNVVSGDTADTAAGTGARTVRLLGLDANGNRASEDVTLNGTTPVTSTTEFLRLQRAYVLTAGSGGTNTGVITIDTTVGDTVMATIGAADGQTLIAAYTIPAGFDGHIFRWSASIARASGAAGSGTIALQTRSAGGAWRTRETQELQTGALFTKDVALNLGPLTDIRIRVLSVSDNDTIISAQFDVMEVED
jgi:hypothetical protein